MSDGPQNKYKFSDNWQKKGKAKKQPLNSSPYKDQSSFNLSSKDVQAQKNVFSENDNKEILEPLAGQSRNLTEHKKVSFEERSEKNSGIFHNSDDGGRDALSKQNDELKLALEQKQAQIQEQTDKIQSQEKQIQQSTTEIEELKRRLRQNEVAGVKSEEIEQQRTEFQLKIGELTNQIEEAKMAQINESEAMNKQNIDLESKVSELKAQLNESQQDQGQFERLKELESQNTELEKQLNAIKDEQGQKELIEIKLKSIEEEKTQMQKQMQQMSIQMQQTSDHQGKIDQLNEEISNHEKNNFELKFTISQLTYQVSEKDKLMEDAKELQQKNEVLNEENSAFEETKAQLYEQISKLNEEINIEKQNKSQLQVEKQMLSNNLVDLQTTNDQLSEKIKSLNQQITSFSESNEIAQQEKSEINDAIARFEQEVAAIKAILPDKKVCAIQSLTAINSQNLIQEYKDIAPLKILKELDLDDVLFVSQGDRQVPKSTDELPEPKASGVAATIAILAANSTIIGVSGKSNDELQEIFPDIHISEQSEVIKDKLYGLTPLLQGQFGPSILRHYYPEIDTYIQSRIDSGKDLNLHYFLYQLFAARLAAITGGCQIILDPQEDNLLEPKSRISAHYLRDCNTLRFCLQQQRVMQSNENNIKTYEFRVTKYKQKIDMLSEKIKAREQQARDFEEQLKASQQQQGVLQSHENNIKTYEFRVTKYKQKIDMLTEKIQARDQKAKDLEEQLKVSQDANFSSDEKIVELEGIISTLENKISSNLKDIKDLERRVTTSSQDNNSYLNISNAQGEPFDLESYEVKDQELHQKFVQQIQLIHDLKSQVYATKEEEYKQKSKHLEQMIKIMSQKIILKNNQIDGLQIILKNWEQEKQVELQNQGQVTSETDESRIVRLTQNVQKLQDKDDMNQLEIYKLQKSLKAEQQLAEEQALDIERLEGQVSSNVIIQTGESLETKGLNAQIKELKQEITNLKENEQIYQENIKQLTQEISILNQEMDDLEEEIAKKDAEKQESNKTAGVEFVEVEKVVEIIKEVPVISQKPKAKSKNVCTQTKTWSNTERDQSKGAVNGENVEALKCTVKLNTTLKEFERKGGVSMFSNNLASAMCIDSSKVKVRDVREGSVIVDYDILIDRETPRKSELEKRQNQIFKDGLLDLGGPVMKQSQRLEKSKVTKKEKPKQVKEEEPHKVSNVTLLNRMLTSEQKQNDDLNKEIKNLKYVISIQQGRIQKLSNRLSRPKSKVQTSEQQIKEQIEEEKRHKIFVEHDVKMFSRSPRSTQGSRLGRHNETIESIRAIEQESENQQNENVFTKKDKSSNQNLRYKKKYNYQPPNNIDRRIEDKQKHDEKRTFVRNHTTARLQAQYANRLGQNRSASNFNTKVQHLKPFEVPNPKKYNYIPPANMPRYESLQQVTPIIPKQSGSESLSIELHSNMFSPSRAFNQKAMDIHQIHQKNLQAELYHQSNRIQEMPQEESFIKESFILGREGTFGPIKPKIPSPIQTQKMFEAQNRLMRDNTVSVISMGSKGSRPPSINAREEAAQILEREKVLSEGGRRKRESRLRPVGVRNLTPKLTNADMNFPMGQSSTPQPSYKQLLQSREEPTQELGNFTGGEIHVGDLNQRADFNSPDSHGFNPTNRFSEREKPIQQMLKKYSKMKKAQEANQNSSRVMEMKYLNEPLSYNYEEHPQTSRTFDKQNVRPRYLDYIKKQ